MMERAQCSNAVARRAIAMILNAPPFSKAPSIIVADDILIFYILVFRKKIDLAFHVNHLLGRRFTYYANPYFL